MKITNLKSRIAAILVAAGLLTPSAASAAMLNTNLVVNPSFEEVDLGTVIGGYDARLVLDWEGSGGAYAFTQNYDNGGPLDGGGERYFTPNATDGAISQDIDVSDGQSATLISTGTAAYNLSAFFSSYAGDGDFGLATLEFFDNETMLDDDFMDDSDTTTWTLESLSGTVPVGTTTVRITLEGVAQAGGPDGYMDLVDFQIVGDVGPVLQAGDADQDLDFDQLDLVKVQIAGKYLSAQSASWGEGDWNGAPGGSPGDPPMGNGQFDQLDIIAALNADVYLSGPYYPALGLTGQTEDGQTSVGYNADTGEVWVDAPAGRDLTSINIDSAAGVFTGQAAQNLGGSFDNDSDNNLFKATFGNSFGSLSFGSVAQTGLSESIVVGDLTVVGSLAGGGDLGHVDLIYVPEPNTAVLLGLGLLGAGWFLHRPTRQRD